MRSSNSAMTLALALAMAATACGGVDGVASEDVPEALPAVVEQAPATSVSSVPDPVDGVEPDPTSKSLSAASGKPEIDAGEATAVTSVPSGSTPEYTGALGYMTLDQLLYGAIAPLPTLEPGTSPLTGLPSPVTTAAVVVKIDNSSKARPQLGLNSADVVIEEQVEGGITRFAAVFQSSHVTVGPVRSGRTTDISFLGSLGQPSLVYSGAGRTIDRLLRALPNVNNYSAARSGGYRRDGSRPAVYDLMTETSTFVTNGAQPPAWFQFDRTGTANVGAPTSTVDVRFPASSATWSWDGANWLRSQNGRAHTTDGGARVAARNVVVAVVPEVLTGLVDTTRAPVPEYVWAGQGRAAFFIDGVRIDGSWTRSRLREPAVFVGDDGTVVEFTPGNTWIELVTAGNFSSR